MYIFIKPPPVNIRKGTFTSEMERFIGCYCPAVRQADGGLYNYRTSYMSIHELAKSGITFSETSGGQNWHWVKDWIIPIDRRHIELLRPDMLLEILLRKDLDHIDLIYLNQAVPNPFRWAILQDSDSYLDYHSGSIWMKDEDAVVVVRLQSLIQMLYLEFKTKENILEYLFNLIRRL